MYYSIDYPLLNQEGARGWFLNQERARGWSNPPSLPRRGPGGGKTQTIMQILNNRKYLKARRKALRNAPTPAEALLWRHLQGRQLCGRKFRRQHSVGNYILDFYCPAEKLAVELDGAGHFTAAGREQDQIRDQYLNGVGISVVRFENQAVVHDVAGVLERIAALFSAPPKSPLLAKEEVRGQSNPPS